MSRIPFHLLLSFFLFLPSSLFLPSLPFPFTGTNVTKAKELLMSSGLPITPAEDFEDVAKKAVASLNL